MDRFIVVTGGPGSGKSTLVEALATCGLATMPEAGRAIIRDQMAIGGNALPWADRHAFAEQMLGWEMRSHRDAQAREGLVLFDRGVPDVIGYLRLCGLPVPTHVLNAAAMLRYWQQVFIAPPWPAIYRTDTERRQDPAEAEATYRAMIAAYGECGYELVPLPLTPVDARAQFVLDRLSLAQPAIAPKKGCAATKP